MVWYDMIWYDMMQYTLISIFTQYSLRWRHNERDGVSNHQPHDCSLNHLFRPRSKKTSKLRVTGLCVGNPPGTSEIPEQMASNEEKVSIWWRQHLPTLGLFCSPLNDIYSSTGLFLTGLEVYRQVSNIRCTLVDNEIVDHSDVVGPSPVSAATTTSSFSTEHLASIYCAKTIASQVEKHLSFGIWCNLY